MGKEGTGTNNNSDSKSKSNSTGNTNMYNVYVHNVVMYAQTKVIDESGFEIGMIMRHGMRCMCIACAHEKQHSLRFSSSECHRQGVCTENVCAFAAAAAATATLTLSSRF